MYSSLPSSSEAFEQLNWSEIEPWYRELTNTSLSQETMLPWLAQWSRLSELVDETRYRHEIACTQNTADEERAQRKQRFLDEIYTPVQTYDQQIKQQLLASGLEPEGFSIPLRNLRTEAALFREENLPLLNQDQSLNNDYYQIGGAQMVQWEGQEVSITSLSPVLADPDREKRERAWRAVAERRLADREQFNEIWIKKMQLRQQIARNANLASYRDYRWRQMLRFDYTPDDCKTFHEAVEQVMVPAASRLWEKRRQRLGLETLRPWDTRVNPLSSEPPRLIPDATAVLPQCAQVFRLLDPQLGGYFDTMIQEQLFDLEERPAKAHVGYNLPLQVKQRPFVFGHVRSIEDIPFLIFHEAGHAFHVFEASPLPYLQQRGEETIPIEFAEVASTSMEFIGSMHLQQAGLCSDIEQTHLRIQHLEDVIIGFLPAIVRGDAFQHWVYEHPEQAMSPEACDQQWEQLTRRYQPDIDWSGLDAVLKTGWQHVSHFYDVPFYYIEYAFAALGAIQVWKNYLRDPHIALQQYRHALSLGATRTLPELFAAAGATFAFDTATLQDTLQLVMHTLEELEAGQE